MSYRQNSLCSKKKIFLTLQRSLFFTKTTNYLKTLDIFSIFFAFRIEKKKKHAILQQIYKVKNFLKGKTVMKKLLLVSVVAVFAALPIMAAYQYNTKGNQGWLTFDADTTVALDLSRSGKDKDHENFIDRGNGVADYGWYNMDTGATGSFANGLTATFSENDRIGLYIKDNEGQVFTSTKSSGGAELDGDIDWGKSGIVDGSIAIYGGNKGSNGTHEYYVFKISTANADGKTPSGQPLPGIIATLVVGGGTVLYLKKRKKLYGNEDNK